MTFQITFHPVDVKLVEERLLPFVRGEGSIDDLVVRAVAIAKGQARAKAFAGALIHQKMIAGFPEGMDLPPGPKPLPRELVPALDAFDKDLHYLGRPFFVVSESAAEVGDAIDRYVAASIAGSPTEVDAIAREMLARLHPELPAALEVDAGPLPADEELAKVFRQELDGLRALRGERVPAKKIAHSLLRFETWLHPAWIAMDRCWPTLFARELIPFFEPATSWLGPLASATLERTITDASMVGGFVPVATLPVLKQSFDGDRLSFETQLREEGYDESGVGAVVRKLDESISYAASHGLGFCEASGIYSASPGVTS